MKRRNLCKFSLVVAHYTFLLWNHFHITIAQYFLRGVLHLCLLRKPCFRKIRLRDYHLMRAEPHVNPLPNAAIQIKSPSLILPCSNASDIAIGIEAAVVFPYFCILLKTWSSLSSSRFCTNALILKLAWCGINKSIS